MLIDLNLFSNSYRSRQQKGGKILNMGKEVSVAASSPQQQRWENPEREREREGEHLLQRDTYASQATIPHICHFFTQAKFLENKIYTEKTRKLRQSTQ